MHSTTVKEIHKQTSTPKPQRRMKFLNVIATHNHEDIKLTRKEVFHQWLATFSGLSSIHGMKWHTYFNFLPLKIFFIIFIFIIVVAMPTFFISEAVDFYTQSHVQTAIKWGKESTLKYPNLTLCFPKLFDKGLIQVEGLSNDLVNYLSMVFDPNAGHLYKLLSKEIPIYATRIANAEKELRKHLNDNKITIIDLFHRISIRCESFITLCEIHGEYFFSNSGNSNAKKCCGDLFNSKPFFTSSGTCFSTIMEVWEEWPFMFSFIKIWTSLPSNLSPEFEVMFTGSDAIEKQGIFFAISDRDHPAAKLLQIQNKISKGHAAHISLNIKKVDQTQLSGDFCHSEDDDSLDGALSYDLPYSKMNCEVFMSADTNANCSMAHFYGVRQENSLRPCEPKDILERPLSYRKNQFPEGQMTIQECLPFCQTTEYLIHLSEGAIEADAVKSFNSISQMNVLGNPEELVVIKLHFNSFDFETHILYQNGFFDFLSKIGGWLGLVLGASILSFLELIYFVSALIFHLITDSD